MPAIRNKEKLFMNKYKRKSFFIKKNFQVSFIICFIGILLLEVTTASFIIYKLSGELIENAAFSSHLIIDTSGEIITPVIIKVNTYVVIISIILACTIAAIMFQRRRFLFSQIIAGIQNIKNNNTSFRVKPFGRKNSRMLIKEFNSAADHLDKRMFDLRQTLNSLLEAKELDQITKLHNKLYDIISGKK